MGLETGKHVVGLVGRVRDYSAAAAGAFGLKK
jgi:hypothetical protein